MKLSSAEFENIPVIFIPVAICMGPVHWLVYAIRTGFLWKYWLGLNSENSD